MEKLIRISIVLLIVLISTKHNHAQPWMSGSENPELIDKTNFYDIQTAFNQYYSTKGIDDAKGWKQFRRWEEFMESRVSATGKLPSSIYYKEYNKTRSQHLEKSTDANWTHLGPDLTPTYIGTSSRRGVGRLNCIAFHPANSDIFWVGAPSGGLWKTLDGGNTWSTATDNLPAIGISDIAVNPVNPDIIYIATGDGDAADTYSFGVMVSSDGGINFSTTGLGALASSGMTIRRLLINFLFPDILLAATNYGIYRSEDAGANWTNIQSGDFKDIEFMSSDPSVVYAAEYGYSGECAVYKSIDAGLNFTDITPNGLVPDSIGRIELAVTAVNDQVLYALSCRNDDDGFHSLYKSGDAGNSWSLQLDYNSINLLGWDPDGGDAGGQGWYDLALAVSPLNEDEVYVGGVNLWKSINGGQSFSLNTHWYGGGGASYVHADQHMLSFNPNTGVLFSCNDGGLYATPDAGISWFDLSDGIQILQIYRCGVSASNQDLIITGSQDNGTFKYSGTWDAVLGGDGMECMIDPIDQDILYATIYYGTLYKSYDGGWDGFADISPPVGGDGAWITPFVMDPSDPDILYAAYSDVYKTTDGGNNWVAISSGLTSDVNLRSIAVAPSNPDYIYAATATSLWRTADGGGNWTALQTYGVFIKGIAVSETNPDKVWLVFSGYTDGVKVYMSTDGGANFSNYSDGLPNIPVNCIRYENGTSDGLYVGTDLGVYYRNDTMTNWTAFNSGLPSVIVNDLEIQYQSEKIRAATFGRGLWESDLYKEVLTPLSAVIDSYTSPSCNGSCNGAVSLIVTGGTTPYAFLWSNDSITQDLSGLCAGQYDVTVTDAAMLTATASVTLVDPQEFTVAVSSYTEPSSIGACDGSATLTTIGGLSPFTYLWQTGGTTNTENALCSGSYTVTATDANGCTAISSVTLNDPFCEEALSLDMIHCYGGDSTDRGYSVINTSDGGYVISGFSMSDNGDVSGNNGASDVWVVKTDEFGAIDWTFRFGGSGPEAAYQTIESTQGFFMVLGYTDSYNGDITNYYGGKDILLIKLDPDGNKLWDTIYGGSSDDVGRTIVENADGSFTIGGYTESNNIDISGNNGGFDAFLLKIDSLGEPIWQTCIGGSDSDAGLGFAACSDGSYLVTGYTRSIDGDIPANYGNRDGFVARVNSTGTIDWSYNYGGSLNDDLNGIVELPNGDIVATGETYSSDGDISFMNGGDDVWVLKLDSQGGIIWSKGFGGSGTDYSKCAPLAEGNEVVVTAMAGSSNGDVVGDFLGAKAWIFRLNAAGDTVWTGTVEGSDLEFSYGLSRANDNSYLITGDTKSTDGDIPQPLNGYFDMFFAKLTPCSNVAALSLTLLSATDPVCYGNDDGGIEVSINGGTSPYTFLWSTGDTTQNISNVPSGTYTLTVTDASFTSESLTVLLNDPDSLLIVIDSLFAVSDSDSCDASVYISVENGSGPYTYLWETGSTENFADSLCIGDYQVSITDANLCSSTALVSISSPLEISVGSQSNPSCFESCNGSVELSVSGGTAPYIYQWPGGGTVSNASDLCAGSYSITVTDAYSNTDSISFTLAEPAQLQLDTLVTASPDSAVCNGLIYIQATGGTYPYTYSWSDGYTDTLQADLCSGYYDITVTDTNSCSQVLTVLISDGFSLIADAVISSLPSCYGLCDGAAVPEIIGGTAPFTYTWSDGSTDSLAISLCSGMAYVTVADSNMLEATDSIYIPETDSISIILDSITDVTCLQCCDAVAFVSVSGGSSPFMYLWSNGDSLFFADTLCSGNYYLTVTDTNACVAEDMLIITNPFVLSVVVDEIVAPICLEDSTGSISILAANGLPPYTYNWSTGSTDSVLENLFAGTYFYTVSDALAYAVSDSVIVSPDSQQGVLLTAPDRSCTGDTSVVLTGVPDGGTYTGTGISTDTLGIFNSLIAGPGNHNVSYWFTDTTGCTDTSMVIISVYQSDVIVITADDTVCQSADTFAIEAIPEGGMFFGSAVDSAGIFYPDSVAAGSASVYYAYTNADGCADTAAVMIFVDAVVPAVFGSLDDVCLMDTAVLLTTGEPQGGVYAGSGVSSGYFNPLVAGIGTHTILYTYPDSGTCTSTDTQYVTVNPEPQFTIQDSNATCNNSADGQLIITMSDSAQYTFSWYPNADTTKNLIDVIAGTYMVSVTASSGCSSTGSAEIYTDYYIQAWAGADKVVCYGDSVRISDTLQYIDTLDYLWIPEADLSYPDSIATYASPQSSAEYVLSVSDGVCTAYDTVYIELIEPFEINAGDDITFYYGDLGTLAIVDPDSTYSYQWFSTYDTNLVYSGAEVLIPGQAMPDGSSVTYYAVARSQYGCNADDSVEVRVNTFLVPKGFTPNGDGINDVWEIDYLDRFEQVVVEVYNRWGKRLFTSENNDQYWDGTYNGNLLPTGTYYYVISAFDANRENHPISGSVTIFR